MKYYKKVLTVDALQWQGEMTEEMKEHLGHDAFHDPYIGWSIICTGGMTRPEHSNWIVRDENGNVSVLHPNIFAERYAEVTDEPKAIGE